jgi:shikimate 5-dehydrogenase
VFDAAYKSSTQGLRLTALLELARDVACPIVEGMEMLFEQGCAQSAIWTADTPPRAEIAKALLKERFQDDPDPPMALVDESKMSTSN